MPTVVISPFSVAGFPEGGGHLWVYLQYVLGLQQMGCDVYWLEAFHSKGRPKQETAALEAFQAEIRQYGLDGRVIIYITESKRAQEAIARARDAGLRVSHLDGHQHVHLHPTLLPAVLRVARRFGIGAVRAASRTVSGSGLRPALIGLVGRNKRRYGGYIVHVGVVLIFLGFAGKGFTQDEQVLLKPGQQAQVGDIVVRLDAVRVTDDGQKQMITAHTTVFRDGEELAKMYPAKWFFRKHEDQPTTEVAIRCSISEDIYLVMPAFNLEEQSASMEIVVNPLVNWVWVGFGFLALGTLIALLPETVFAFALARVPANAVTTSLLLLSLVLWPAAVIAQSGETVSPTQRSALQRRLESEIMCTCGACRSTSGSLSASFQICSMTSQKRSRVSLLSVSVGSIMRASWTMGGK